MFAKNLKYLRNKAKMEQMDLAKLLGRKSSSSISDWEKGRYTPKLGTLNEIAKVFNVNLDDMMEKDLSKPPSQRSPTLELRKYNFYPTAISAGIPDHVAGISECNQIDIPDSIMGRHAGQRDIFITRVNGESMNRIIPDGSLIAVKPVEIHQIKDGDVIVYSDGGDYSVKRFYKRDDQLIFKPDSKNESFYDYITTIENTDLKIHGKVVIYIVELD